MKKRPILFSSEMVRAILDGRKTQTRRIIKPQPKGVEPSHWYFEKNNAWWTCGENTGKTWKCPYGKFGDQLWVRETFCIVNDDGTRWIDYKATPRYEASHPAGWENAPNDPEALKWKPSIFMPRWASRIQLKVIDVRVERIQDISEDDVQAEGFCESVTRQNSYPIGTEHRPNAQEYAIGWDKINGKGSWESNPWVWVIEFRKIKRRKQ